MDSGLDALHDVLHLSRLGMRRHRDAPGAKFVWEPHLTGIMLRHVVRACHTLDPPLRVAICEGIGLQVPLRDADLWAEAAAAGAHWWGDFAFQEPCNGYLEVLP